MKTAVIFGATGQDGVLLSAFLTKKKYRIVGVARHIENMCGHPRSFAGEIRDVTMVRGSVNDFSRVKKIIDEFQPCEVYNLAGLSSVSRSFKYPRETFQCIADGTQNILEAVRTAGLETRLFNAGSGECFGDAGEEIITEDTAFSPQSPYAAAKAAAHGLVSVYRKAYGMYACTGILFNHESYLRPDTFVTKKIVKTACKISRGECDGLTLGNISIERDWGWAPEYVDAMWRMLQQEQPEDFILSTGKTVSLKIFIDKVFSRLGLNWQNHVTIDAAFFRPTDTGTMKPSPVKAEKKLQWKAKFSALDVAEMMVDAELENFRHH